VISEQFNLLGINLSDSTKMIQALAPLQVVVRSLRREYGYRMVVGRQLSSEIIGVAHVKQPSVAHSDRDSTVAYCMTEERD